MKVIRDIDCPCSKVEVGSQPSGTAFINGEGNICINVRDANLDIEGKVRMVNLEMGASYSVKKTCLYERVEAVVTWKRRAVS